MKDLSNERNLVFLAFFVWLQQYLEVDRLFQINNNSYFFCIPNFRPPGTFSNAAAKRIELEQWDWSHFEALFKGFLYLLYFFSFTNAKVDIWQWKFVSLFFSSLLTCLFTYQGHISLSSLPPHLKSNTSSNSPPPFSRIFTML